MESSPIPPAPGASADAPPPVAVVADPSAEQPTDDSVSEPCWHSDVIGRTEPRNLVVCIDGTSNQFSTKNTNVVELYSRLVKDDTQLTFYNSGIGTYAKPSWKSWEYRKQVIANALDLAFALRFEKIIISAYAWLVDNYQPGDRIFLFGFSRGAYQVRALAAMIDIVGLLHKGNTDQIPFAYELYAASEADKKNRTAEASSNLWRDIRPLRERISQKWKARRGDKRLPSFPWPAEPTEPANTSNARPVDNGITMKKQFKNTFSRQGVRVHFVGAWDTVSSVGFIRDKTLPSTTDGMRSVCFFRHALALHEFRVKFLPEYVNGGAGPSMSQSYTSGDPHTKEVWFTGSHSDIGGGSSANTSLDKFGPALRWMSWEAMSAGLRLVQTPDNWEPMRVSPSMTNVWRIVECLPIKRLTYPAYDPSVRPPTGSSFTSLPHFFAHRQIQPWQRIHQSVYEECQEFDTPSGAMMEADAYLILPPQAEVLRRGWIYDDARLLRMQRFTSTGDGVHSLDLLGVSRYIYDLARMCWDKRDERAKILSDLAALNDAYLRGSFLVTQVEGPLELTDVTKIASDTFPFRMCGHTEAVSSVSFLSDTEVVSYSRDETLRIWDVDTGNMTLRYPLSGHGGVINCGAVHAARGFVAFASGDSTICLSMFDRNETDHERQFLRDEVSTEVLAVAFSPDGSLLVSGSNDGAMRVWEAATGKRVGNPVYGHTGPVRSVAFSTDEKQIISGSDDRTVRSWELPPGQVHLQPCGEPLAGHTGSVWSVAFSLDRRFIASGSEDRSVHIWDAEHRIRTPTCILEGHTSGVRSVAFAPRETYVVSGSNDLTVHIWDILAGAAVRVIRGHTDWVTSVAFSPNGMRIASGSIDNTVRVWDLHHNEDALAACAQIASI